MGVVRSGRHTARGVSGRARVLETLVDEHGWTFGVELGVFRGDTFLHLLRSCPRLRMLGVDTWRPLSPDPIYPGGRTYASWPLEEFYRTLQQRIETGGFTDRAVLIRAETPKAAAVYGDGLFDFVFVDADHTTPGVVADIFAWAPKIQPGGWMLGHDYNRQKFPGVVRAVDTVFPSRALYDDTVWGCPIAESVFGL